MRTASESWAPAASTTVLRFSRHWRAWSPIDPSARLPVLGSIGTWPEQKSRPPERTAWLYGPAGLGASGAGTGWRGGTGGGLSRGAEGPGTSGPGARHGGGAEARPLLSLPPGP